MSDVGYRCPMNVAEAKRTTGIGLKRAGGMVPELHNPDARAGLMQVAEAYEQVAEAL